MSTKVVVIQRGFLSTVGLVGSGFICLLWVSQALAAQNSYVLATLKQQAKIQQQEQKKNLKQAFFAQRLWSSKHHDNTRGTGKKREFGQKRTQPKGKRPW